MNVNAGLRQSPKPTTFSGCPDAQIVLAHEDELDMLFATTEHGEMAGGIQ